MLKDRSTRDNQRIHPYSAYRKNRDASRPCQQTGKIAFSKAVQGIYFNEKGSRTLSPETAVGGTVIRLIGPPRLGQAFSIAFVLGLTLYCSPCKNIIRWVPFGLILVEIALCVLILFRIGL